MRYNKKPRYVGAFYSIIVNFMPYDIKFSGRMCTARKRNGRKGKMNEMRKSRLSVKMIAQIGMLAAIATVLMLFEIPLPFAPSFYEIDFSEVPVLVGAFTMGCLLYTSPSPRD